MRQTVHAYACIVKRVFHYPFREADSPLYMDQDRLVPLGFRDALWAQPGQQPCERRR